MYSGTYPKGRCMTDLNSAPATEGADSTLALLQAPAPHDVREWLSYDRPAEFESVRFDVQVPTRDGTLLSARLFRPGRNGQPVDGRFSGLVADFTPYDIGQNQHRHDYLAERGYNVLVCYVRGSGDSAGEFAHWFQAVEAEDNYDAIEWLAAQPFSTGKIGQYGESYGSITACRVAALNPPSLQAIAPIASPTNIYEWLYPGGVPTANPAWWSGQGPIIDAAAHANNLKSFQDHPLFDEHWEQVVTTNKIASATVPALFVGGHYDIFKEGGYDALKQRPTQTWLLYGPWMHAIPFQVADKVATVERAALQSIVTTGANLAEFGPHKLAPFGTILHWFDYWLEEKPTAKLPPARIISYEDNSTPVAGRWTAAEQWPPTESEVTRLYPTAEGDLVTAAPHESTTDYSVDPFDGPSASLIGSSPTDETRDQQYREQPLTTSLGRYSGGRTTFTTHTFDEGTAIAGMVKLHVRASITADDTHFVGKLEAVLSDGRVLPIETGSLRARLRASRKELEAIPAGVPVDYEIEIGHTHWRFEAGEQLRVALSAGDFPRILPTAPAGIVTIHHGEHTYVELPLALDRK